MIVMGSIRSLLLLVGLLGCMQPLTTHAEQPEFKFAGTAELFSAQYFDHVSGKHDTFAQIRLRPKLTAKLSDAFAFLAQADLRQDTEGIAYGTISGVAEDEHPWAVNLSEFYAEYNRGILWARLGKQIFDWSVTDTVSPSDNLSPRDWSDLIEWERVGVPAVNLRVGQDRYLQMVYVPFFTPSKLPLQNDRWIPEALPELTPAEADRPDTDRGQFALRLGAALRGVDLAITYFNGFSISPAFLPVADGNAAFRIRPVYFKAQVVSASMATQVAAVAVRAEAGYFDQDGEDDFVQYVLGADREWVNTIKPTDSFYVLIQYVHELKIHARSLGDPELTDFRRIFNNSLLARLKYTFSGERWALKLEAVCDLADHDSYIAPTVILTLKNLEVELGVSMISGSTGTFWGGFASNDRLFLKGVYSF
jgi:hypothetical protein